jgi:hypothetical protein
MFKTYTIKGKDYQTVKIPKGTVLFRGLSFENKNNFATLFNDLIGLHTGHGYAIAPTMNVFFYPVPYVSDSVNVYNIHTMYLTQYDIELLLLVLPSTISRANKNSLDPKQSPITRCSHIGEYDKCGFKLSVDDPCLTDLIIKFYPQIDGYIGIAEQDVAIFTQKYKKIVSKLENYEKASQIIPSIIMDAKGLSGIPEIVIHPLRFRHEDCLSIRNRFYNSERIVRYCTLYRAQYNYFPLLYFTNNGIFTFNDLRDETTIESMANSVRISNGNTTPKLYDNINEVFGAMLKGGYSVNKTNYRVLVDRRTGFYRALIPTLTNTARRTRKKVQREGTGDGFEGYLDAFIVKPSNNSEINTILSKHPKYIDEDLLANLQANGYSLKKTLGFKRKAKNKFMYNYYINKMINRPDIEDYNHLRGKRNLQTRKKNNMAFSKTLEFYGLTEKELDNVSSVESDF